MRETAEIRSDFKVLLRFNTSLSDKVTSDSKSDVPPVNSIPFIVVDDFP